MKKTFLLFTMLVSTVGFAQSKDGGISKDVLNDLRHSYTQTQSDIALRNAINTTPIFTLAKNADNAAMIDTHFSDIVTTKGRTDQHSSGRCWLFTGLNVLRADMISKYNLGSLTFSQTYLFFYDQLEKANLFLQGVIDTRNLDFEDRKVDFLFKSPIGDGGQFTGVANLVMKYGVVPSSVMPETYVANNTSQFRSLLSTRLRKAGLELRHLSDSLNSIKLSKNQVKYKLLDKKNEALKDIYRMLALSFGVPPTSFEWTMYDKDDKCLGTKTYTPQSFYKDYINLNLEKDYIMVMNDPTRPYNKVYEIDYDRHVYDGQNWKYLNLPIDDIKQLAIASIKDNTAMYFSCDVGKYYDREKGVLDLKNFDFNALMGVNFDMNKEQRVKSNASASSHAMTLIAVDLKDGKPTKWMVENSWGENNGYKGNLIMTDDWFNEYMFRLVVQKKYVPENILKLLDQKPIMLPAWDPMFSDEM